MTGPEHWREAERLLTAAAEAESGSPDERYCLAAAQAHATMANAAAVIEAAAVTAEAGGTDVDRAWRVTRASGGARGEGEAEK